MKRNDNGTLFDTTVVKRVVDGVVTDVDKILRNNGTGFDLVYSAEPPVIHALKFESDTAFSLKTNNSLKNWDGVLEYSIDGKTWIVWSGTVAISSSNTGVLYIRGTGNTAIIGSVASNGRWVFSYATELKAIGNIEYLLDWETVANNEHPTMGEGCFRYMFRDTPLVLPPDMPMLEIPELGCQYMYYQSLIKVPPTIYATKIGNQGLQTMCYRVTNIKISTLQTGNYQTPWRVPAEGNLVSGGTSWNDRVFAYTGGTFTGTPNANTTYWVDVT